MAKILKYKKWLVLIFIVAILALGGFWFFKNRHGGFETYTVVKEDITESIFASGSLEPKLSVTLHFETPGKLVYAPFRVGDAVKRGQVVGRLDTTVLNSEFQKAKSDLRAAEATLEQVYDEVKDHSSDETFTLKEKRTLAEVAKDKAYENFISAQKRLKNATLISPIDGVIVYTSFGAVGQNVSVTDAIELVSFQSGYFLALLDEVDFTAIKEGDSVLITLDAFAGEQFSGEVALIRGKTVATVGGANAIPLEISIAWDERFVYGLTGDSEFILEEKLGVLTVPRKAILKDGEKTYVNKKGKHGSVKTFVSTGKETGGKVEVVSGLSEGDVVLIGKSK